MTLNNSARSSIWTRPRLGLIILILLALGGVQVILMLYKHSFSWYQFFALLALAIGLSSLLASIGTKERPFNHIEPGSGLTPNMRPFQQMSLWEDRLMFLEEGSSNFQNTKIYQTLRALTADSLQLHHGLHLDTHPDQCRELLGRDLYRLLTVPSPSAPTEAELAQYIATLERLTAPEPIATVPTDYERA